MGRLQNNPSIGWVHPKSTHARPLAWDNNKRGIATAFRSQPRIGKIHDTVAVELLLLSAPAKMPLHQRTLLPLEYTSGSGAREGSTCGVVPHRCGFRSVCHRLPVSSQANSSVFCLSLCLSPFPHSLFFFFFFFFFFLLKNPPSTSPLRFPQEYLEERKKKDCWIVLLAADGRVFCCLKTRILLERRTEENRRLHFHQVYNRNLCIPPCCCSKGYKICLLSEFLLSLKPKMIIDCLSRMLAIFPS